jgi:heme/copper-type cytochrome/quinol oxidase subunit 2
MLHNKLLKLKVVCIILFCVSFAMAGLIFSGIAKLFLLKEYDSILDPLTLVAMGGFILIGVFQLKCFNLVVNKYPDKELTNRNDSVFSLLFIFSSIVFLGIFFCFVAFLFSLLNDKTPQDTSILFYCILTTIIIYISCHIYCMQQSFALRKIIKVNYYESQNNMINTIGEDYKTVENI